MTKFAKQYEEQLVPEWKDAFLDYPQLKTELKKICFLNTTKTSNHNISPHRKKYTSLKATLVSSVREIFQYGQKHRDHGPIQVHRIPAASSASTGEEYETELLEQLEDVEAASEFFTLLDLQLNKVNQFYKMKEGEFVEMGESLKQQMEILVELKTALKLKREGGAQLNELNGDSTSISCHISCEESADDGNAEEPEIIGMRLTESLRTDETETSSRIIREHGSLKGLSGQVFTCRGKSIALKIPLTNPSRTFSAVSYLIREDAVNLSNKCSIPGNKLHVSKTKLNQAEKMIRGALIELYKGLGYLKTYRNLNMIGFAKVLEKFDKVTNKDVTRIYLRVVESSYFNSSDKIMRLADEVEDLYVKQFSEGDRKKAMKYLNPNHRKESHAVTFFIGLFTGCFLALLAGYISMARIAGIYTQPSNTVYMETVYPILSIFSLLFLHFFLYGCNIFMWRKARINYVFIFELTPTKELKYREVFLICSTSMAVMIGVLCVHLSLLAKVYKFTQVQAIPGILLLCFMLLLVSPLNIVYKSSRYQFLSVIRNIAFSPLYKVGIVDFFMADQLCSQVPLMRNLMYVVCYYITESYKNQDYRYCTRTAHYRDLAYAVSFLPYYWRAMQCARRWFDKGETSHLYNLGKYVSAMLAAGAKLAYEKEKSVGYLCLVVALSSAATVYQLYWDYVKDWGLLQCDSKNQWLRNELIIRKKFVYYVSMVLNLILRLAWIQTVLHPFFGNVDDRVMGLFLAALEVIRRGQWNFYRLENEHLTNAGKFRAVRKVPLPFHDMDEED